MALLSNIPTSFVPHTPGAPRKFRADLTSAFNFLAYFVFAIVFALALGVFLYGRILASSQSAKDAELAKAQASIDPTTVEGFVRLRDRLTSGEKLLSNHVALSGFFSVLETLVPTTVRFVSLHLSLDTTGLVKVDGSGVAKSFNALAAASIAFAGDGRIKDAIFSHITIDQRDGSVSFSLSGSLDPKLIAFSPDAYATAPPARTATSTATSTPISTATSTATSTP